MNESIIPVPRRAEYRSRLSYTHRPNFNVQRDGEMTESEFMDQVDETLEQIEEVLDAAESDLDYESQGGMMTVSCENGSQIIFTRQPPLKQLWVATRNGGFHFDFNEDKGQWLRDSDAAELGQVLTSAFAEQAGETLDFSSLA